MFFIYKVLLLFSAFHAAEGSLRLRALYFLLYSLWLERFISAAEGPAFISAAGAFYSCD